MDEEGVAKVFVSPRTLATASPSPSAWANGRSASPPRLRPFGRQPKTEISFGLCYNNDATTIKKRSLGVARPLLCSPRTANRDATVGCWVEESFYYVRTRHERRPSRPPRVVKELMAALMRFPAAVYQFSFVNVAPSFPPSVGDPRAPGISILGWS